MRTVEKLGEMHITVLDALDRVSGYRKGPAEIGGILYV
jgi:hypothetical protein